MDPVSLGLMALPSIANLITGSRQSSAARKLKPRGVNNQLKQKNNRIRRKSIAGTDTLKTMQDAEIDQGVSTAVNRANRGSKSSGNILNTISAVSANANRAKRGSLADFFRRKRDDEWRLDRSDSEIAREKFANDQMFANTKAQLLGASQMNTAGALENMSTNALAYYLNKKTG